MRYLYLCERATEGKDYGELYAKLDMTLIGIVDDLAKALTGFQSKPVKRLTSCGHHGGAYLLHLEGISSAELCA